MVKSSDLMGVVSDKEFNTACQKTRIRDKARQVAYDVLVAGLDIKEVAAKNKMSYQRVKNICVRVFSEVERSDSVEFTVKMPAEIAPYAQQVLNTIKTIYELRNSKKGQD
ncbi:hypothetical protein FEF33_03875 [Moraxella osloensis]|jgi:hypothetical protein|nr:hypothetical protein FEF33_03875 [Moraxella osloensis]RVU81471.1 hypothetical protein EOL70_26920 [Leucothrix sargassi]